ncbi:hypothetical protein U3516DRAFT_857880 [Neocallimastix sp. 'constans']
MNHKIKDGIEKSSILFGVKIKPLYNKISKEIGLISKLFREYNDNIFVDGTVFIVPKFSYQIFITRTYGKELDKSFNKYLNNLFLTKSSFYELIDKLNELEHLSYYDYQRKLRGIWKIKKRAINKDNEISVLIERYKNIEAKLIDAKCDRNNIINLWFDCLTDLNNII